MMVILDTNVINEILKSVNGNRNVIDWLVGLDRDETYITAVNTAELLYGLALVPPGRKRFALSRAIDEFIEQYRDHTLPFGAYASAYYASIAAKRRREGRPISVQDAMIAAIARSHGMTLATRNVRDFEGTGVTIINPWEPAA